MIDIKLDNKGTVDLSGYAFTSVLEQNVAMFREIFNEDDTIKFRDFENGSGLKFCAIFADGMVSTRAINLDIIQTLMFSEFYNVDDLEHKTACNEATWKNDMREIVTSMLYGDTVLLAQNCDRCLVLNTKGWQSRSISEPDDEKALRGPREGFTEAILTNTSLIRRKILSDDLKFSFVEIGERTKTRVCVCYMQSLVNKEILTQLRSRLNSIDIDGLLSSNYIEEMIKDSKFSILKTIGSTEKPDIVAAKLLEGRIAVLVDGTPIVLTLPYLFIENFQAADDYYINFYYSSFNRILRILAFILTISVPAVYVAIVCYHQEMIPATLLYSIVAAAKGVPFPAIVECIGMLLVFELLRESGIRMPSKIGHALSIVGALVIGQSAVEAKLVSAPMVIVVAITGITGLMVPRIKGFVILSRILFLTAAAFFGIYAYYFCIIVMVIYLCSLNSFGVPFTSGAFNGQRDIYIRMPLSFLKKRPFMIAADEKRSK